MAAAMRGFNIDALFNLGGSGSSGAQSPNMATQAAFDPQRPISRSRTTGFARPGDIDKTINRLPAPAAAKLRNLLDEQAELRTYIQSLAGQQADLANQRTDAQGLVTRLRASRTAATDKAGSQSSYFDLSLARGAVPDGSGVQHHVPQQATNEQLKGAEAQVARRSTASARTSNSVWPQRTRSVATWRTMFCSGWCRSRPMSSSRRTRTTRSRGFVTGASEAAPPRLNGETTEDVSDIREQIAELVASIHTVRSAPLPSAEAKARMRAQVAALAATGAPQVHHLVEHGHKVQFAEVSHQAQVLGGTAPAIASHTTPNAQGLLAWLFHDQLVAKLDAEIDECADDDAALTDTEKRDRENNIRDDVLSLERQEVALIEALAASGAAVKYRDSTDPRALLGLSSTLPAPAQR
jgi:hypothetical protein